MIELIFVIVILGILASVAIPRLAATRADAEISAALANIRTFLSDAAAFYTARGDFIDPNNPNNNVTYAAFTNVPFWYMCSEGNQAGGGGKADGCDGKSSSPVRFLADTDSAITDKKGGPGLNNGVGNRLPITLLTGSRKSPCLGMFFAGSNGNYIGGNGKKNEKGFPLIVLFKDLGATDTTCRAIINSQEIQNYLNNKVSLIDKTFNGSEIKETLLEIPGAVLVGQSASIYGRAVDASGNAKP